VLQEEQPGSKDLWLEIFIYVTLYERFSPPGGGASHHRGAERLTTGGRSFSPAGSSKQEEEKKNESQKQKTKERVRRVYVRSTLNHTGETRKGNRTVFRLDLKELVVSEGL